MKYRFDKNCYIMRLQKNELLIESLSSFAKETHLQGAWLQGLGGALWVELGFYDLANKQYRWQKKDALLEIVSLQGNLVWNDEQVPQWHVHGVFSNSSLQAFGGHVKELAVAGTCELLILPLDALSRSHDEAVGLSLLNV